LEIATRFSVVSHRSGRLAIGEQNLAGHFIVRQFAEKRNPVSALASARILNARFQESSLDRIGCASAYLKNKIPFWGSVGNRSLDTQLAAWALLRQIPSRFAYYYKLHKGRLRILQLWFRWPIRSQFSILFSDLFQCFVSYKRLNFRAISVSLRIPTNLINRYLVQGFVIRL
jgi:hypothetical protein